MSSLASSDAAAADTVPAPTKPKKVRVHHLAQAKQQGRKLTMLTAYDALIAPLLDAAGVDMLLVGDSYGNVMLGYDSTLRVTLDDMVRATAAVARSTRRALVVADLPFATYEASAQQAFESASQLMRAGAHAVKLEGGRPRVEAVRLLSQSGIPVVGHLGYTPQSENTIGGPRMRGRGDQRDAMIADALALQDAGAIAVVLEMVPDDVATDVTAALEIPTIGIGAGPHTDGQVLVWSDMVGMQEWVPSFVHRFAQIGREITAAAAEYVESVEDGTFPAPENYHQQ